VLKGNIFTKERRSDWNCTMRDSDLYTSPSIIRMMKSRRMRWVGHIARMRGRLLVGKLEGRRPLGRPRLRWVDKMDLGEIARCHMDRIGLAQDKDLWSTLVNAVMNLWVP
jgi:hypothetical protein